ncbi:MAG: aminodeoxychorismate synthase component I, partial [Hyphomonadaceae bacterium]|nr:aminodeoxychorismate synthase component I [Hyphomonadaceae bacterium]
MISFSAGAPFVLCEDAAGGTPARLFANPREVVRARTLADVGPALAALRAGLRAGYHAAGWLNYEAGLALEPRLAARKPALEAPLLWFGLFDGCTLLAAEDVAAALPDGAGAWLSPPRPRITRTQYDAAFARTQAYIRAGDVYQINLSYRADLTMLGDPCAAYARLRRAGRGSWSALVHEGGGRWLLSTSPELFFRLEGGTIEAKPMKGTARREADPARDAEAAARLRADPKERAENVMIVDLLRNDISKLAERGSVHVPELFTVETYPTLHTLTSTVRARLKPHHDAIDALMALFPCGSITGAPKIRAMEIIDELEGDSRGAYTGSIGWMAPDGAAAFNVAIRTIAVDGAEAQVGLGSAVVIDSTAQGEWEECRIKAGFISAGAPDFALIETMRFEPGAGVRLLERHLARLRRSARVFGFDFDEAHVRAALAAALAGAGETVARLTLARDGRAAVSLRPM